MNKPIKQHYVPQVYLKNFARKKDKIWEVSVMDKKQEKSYNADIRDVAFKKNFYTIEELGEEKYLWEKYYAETVEPLISKVFKQLMQKCTIIFTKNTDTVINDELRAYLSLIIITQLLRTPKSRSFRYNISERRFPVIMKRISRDLQEYNLLDEQQEALESITLDDIFKRIDMNLVVDNDRIEKFSRFLFNKIWVIYRNDDYETNPFVTSDNPVVQYNMGNKSTTLSDNGICNPNTIMLFPINSRLILSLYDRNNFIWERIKEYDGQIVFLNDRSDSNYVMKMNKLQYEQCTQQIYFCLGKSY